MKCPECRCEKSTVVNSRQGKDGKWWRRRKCLSCGFRWTTYEYYDYETLCEVEEWKKSMKC